MMSNDDVTLHVLKEIRDEIRGTNVRLDRVETRLGGVESRLERVDTRLDEGLTGLRTEMRDGLAGLRADFRSALAESEMRTATAINETTFAVREMTAMLRDRLDLRGRVERCERDIDELKRKVQ